MLEVQIEKAVEAVLNSTIGDIRNNLRDNGIDFEGITAEADNKIIIKLFYPDSLKETQEILRDYPFFKEAELHLDNRTLTYQLDSR